jgi:creatinine amidohydrolase/Fe(II)-dependent formamide hydrolase-like protein
MTWPEVAAALASGVETVVVPLGATEQHGHHLVLATDTVNVRELARLAAERSGRALVAPALPFGVSDNHMDFPGTITLHQETLIRLLEDVVASLFQHGFRTAYLLVGHGGDLTAAHAAAERLRQAWRERVVGVIYTPLLYAQSRSLLESSVEWHADEAETSVTLALNPWAVRPELAVDELPASTSHPFTFRETALVDARVHYGIPRTEELSRSGTIGEPSRASRAKGEAMVAESVETLVRILAREVV